MALQVVVNNFALCLPPLYVWQMILVYAFGEYFAVIFLAARLQPADARVLPHWGFVKPIFIHEQFFEQLVVIAFSEVYPLYILGLLEFLQFDLFAEFCVGEHMQTRFVVGELIFFQQVFYIPQIVF